MSCLFTGDKTTVLHVRRPAIFVKVGNESENMI